MPARALFCLLPLALLLGCPPPVNDGLAVTSGGTWQVELEEVEYPTGWNDLHLFAIDTDGNAVTGLTFTADVSMPSMGHGSTEDVETSELTNGEYLVEAFFQMGGPWQLDGSFASPSDPAETFAIAFDVVSD